MEDRNPLVSKKLATLSSLFLFVLFKSDSDEFQDHAFQYIHSFFEIKKLGTVLVEI